MLGSFALSAFAAELFGDPLPGLSSRTLGDSCLQKFLVSPPGPDIPQSCSEEQGCPGLWVAIGRDFSGSLSDHQSALMAGLPSTEAQCLPRRPSPGTRKLPEGCDCSLPRRNAAWAVGYRGLTYNLRPHSQCRAVPGPNLRSSDPQPDSFKTTCAYLFLNSIRIRTAGLLRLRGWYLGARCGILSGCMFDYPPKHPLKP